MPASWVRIAGGGRIVQGPCVVVALVWYCKNQGNQCTIYDGLDAIAGKQFCKLSGGNTEVIHLPFGDGVQFANGIYVDQSTTNDELTICFIQ